MVWVSKVDGISTGQPKSFAEGGCILGRKAKFDKRPPSVILYDATGTDFKSEEFGPPTAWVDVVNKGLVPNFLPKLCGRNTFFGATGELQKGTCVTKASTLFL